MFGSEGDGNEQFCSHSAQSLALFLLAGAEAEYPRHPSDRSAKLRNAMASLLSLAQRTQLLALPTSLPDLEEFYTLTPTDREFAAARRTATNRLGIAVQLCFLRRP